MIKKRFLSFDFRTKRTPSSIDRQSHQKTKLLVGLRHAVTQEDEQCWLNSKKPSELSEPGDWY